jgi:hypothetical protein
MNEEKKDKNVELLEELEIREIHWNETIIKLAKQINIPVQEIIELQGLILSHRQRLTEEIKTMSYQMFKIKQMLKVKEKERLEFYLTSFPIKTNSGEKSKLIESDLSLYQYKMDIIETHINFLIESKKTIDNINYAAKGKIEILKLTQME